MSARVERLVELLAERELDALLVTDLTNVRYLTGFTGSSGLALAGADVRRFVTDFRYVEQAAEQVDGFDRSSATQDLLEALPEALPGAGLRLGFDDAQLSVRAHARLRELLGDRVELVAAGGLVERLRAVKDEHEIARIRAAAQLADASLLALLERGVAGRTERELALALESDMRERGAREPSFATIVAAAGHGALPHAEPRERPIPAGTLVVIDWGAELDGYCSDCTRTVASGDLDDAAREVYELVLDAQEAGLAAVAAGRGGRDVDAVSRRIIEQGGHGERFGHGLGHGVGLDVHEGPRLSRTSEDVLEAGNVVTVEPGVYVPGRFGVRIEDLVVVRDGAPEVLSAIPKTLTRVD